MNNKTSELNTEQRPRPRKANECFKANTLGIRPAPLFDGFWYEGELALFFGAPGTGKSILAVQIADALARGRPLEGFKKMPTGRRKVLYVDLVLRDAQFQTRYSYYPRMTDANSMFYKFAERLYRDRPPADDDICEWLRATVRENGFQAVIIDDISAVKRTHDGTRETLQLMRRLRRIRDELNISILVLVDCERPGRTGIVSEYDLRRSRVLGTVADSVFAIGRNRQRPDERFLIQTRSRSASIYWNEQNAPTCHLTRSDTGLLCFEFDKRFAPKMDEELRQLICRISSMYEVDGLSYRKIASELAISKTRVAKLYHKWTPDLEENEEPADDDPETEEWEDEPEEWEEAECEKAAWLENGNHTDEAPALSYESDEHLPDRHELDQQLPVPCELEAAPFDHSPDTPLDTLKRGFDSYGEIFIESEDAATGKPTVWYRLDRDGSKLRHERKAFGVIVERADDKCRENSTNRP